MVGYICYFASGVSLVVFVYLVNSVACMNVTWSSLTGIINMSMSNSSYLFENTTTRRNMLSTTRWNHATFSDLFVHIEHWEFFFWKQEVEIIF